MPVRLDEPRGSRRAGDNKHGTGTNRERPSYEDRPARERRPPEESRESRRSDKPQDVRVPRRAPDDRRALEDRRDREDRRAPEDPRDRVDRRAPDDRRAEGRRQAKAHPPREGRRSGRSSRWRRSAMFPVITVASVAVVAAAGFTAYRLGPGRPNPNGLAATFGVIGNSKAIAALEAERQQILAMNAATHVFTTSEKPLTASVPSNSSDSSTSGTVPVFTAPDPAQAQLIAQELMPSYGFSVAGQWSCLYDLWERESGWSYDAENVSSGAYGIPQSLPASKMAMFGADYLTDATTQIKWGLWYIQNRYGTPCEAWDTELAQGSY